MCNMSPRIIKVFNRHGEFCGSAADKRYYTPPTPNPPTNDEIIEPVNIKKTAAHRKLSGKPIIVYILKCGILKEMFTRCAWC